MLLLLIIIKPQGQQNGVFLNNNEGPFSLPSLVPHMRKGELLQDFGEHSICTHQPPTTTPHPLHGPSSVADYCLVGPVVKAPASRAADPGFEPHLRRDFSWSSITSDLKIGTPMATLPGAWRYRVSAGTGRPQCQCTVTGWGGKFDLQLLSQCDST